MTQVVRKITSTIEETASEGMLENSSGDLLKSKVLRYVAIKSG